MSATITTDIFCDICSQWSPDISVSGVQKVYISEARGKAKTRGWIYKKINGRMLDICPSCQEADRLREIEDE